MKALIRIIWFAVAIVLLQKVGGNMISTNVGSFSDKLNTFVPNFLQDKIDFKDYLDITFITQLIFSVVLFLGLDLISGDIKGLIKGPIKLLLNGILYFLGFSVIFIILDEFSIIL